jgi:hypothetical protein
MLANGTVDGDGVTALIGRRSALTEATTLGLLVSTLRDVCDWGRRGASLMGMVLEIST